MKAKQLLSGAALCLAAILGSQAQAAGELKLYAWVDYIPPDVPKDFAKEHDLKLTWDVHATTEELEAKLLTGKSGYDVVMPNATTVKRLRDVGAFLKLDKSKLPNWKHLDPDLLKVFAANDPGNEYAIPYMYGLNIIGFNPDKVKAVLGDNAPVDSWDLIFKEEYISKLKSCGVAMMDSPEEIMPIVLHYLGLNPNSENPADYDKATELMLKIRPYVAYFHSAKYMTDIAQGDICVAVGYSGSFYQFGNRAKEAGAGIMVDWRLPKEGAPLWYDNFAIPSDSQNIDEAHAFLNNMLNPEVIAPVSGVLGYPNANKDGMKLVDPAISENPNLSPTGEQLKTLYAIQALPQATERVRTRAWNRIKSGR